MKWEKMAVVNKYYPDVITEALPGVKLDFSIGLWNYRINRISEGENKEPLYFYIFCVLLISSIILI